ncbi:hypothetical protein ANO11243_037720 [Dothideomycetidae sp. 11243]|nr:hypothetical protein ANO11243_037720 [fungal sp. No.11243]
MYATSSTGAPPRNAKRSPSGRPRSGSNRSSSRSSTSTGGSSSSSARPKRESRTDCGRGDDPLGQRLDVLERRVVNHNAGFKRGVDEMECRFTNSIGQVQLQMAMYQLQLRLAHSTVWEPPCWLDRHMSCARRGGHGGGQVTWQGGWKDSTTLSLLTLWRWTRLATNEGVSLAKQLGY